MLGTDSVPLPAEGAGEGADDDAADWAIPADRAGIHDLDPWLAVIDDLAEEAEHPFQYPAGLP